MKVSYSRIETYKQCKYQYYLRYIEGLKTKFDLDPENALVLGTALHTGIEKDVVAAIRQYYSNYPTINELHILEALKLEHLIPKAKAMLPEGVYEERIDDDSFIGFMDLLVDVGDNYYDLYDFKYSNNKKNYLEKGQLHVYKYQFEQLNPSKRIRDMYFVFVPKIKKKRNEDIDEFKERLLKELKTANIDIVKVEYNEDKVIEFWTNAQECVNCTEFDKNPTRLCQWCNFKRYCESNGKNDSNIIYPEEIKKED